MNPVILPVIGWKRAGGHFRPDTRCSRVNAEILGWRTDTDEGEADSQRLSIYSVQPRDAATFAKSLDVILWGWVDVMAKLRSFGAILGRRRKRISLGLFPTEYKELWWCGVKNYLEKLFFFHDSTHWPTICLSVESVTRWQQVSPQLDIIGPFMLVWVRSCRGISLRRQACPLNPKPWFYRNKLNPKCLFALTE